VLDRNQNFTESTTGLFHEADYFISLVISRGLLPRGFQIKILYEFLISCLGITDPMPPCLLSITHAIVKKIGTFSPDSPCPQKAYNSSDYRGRPVFRVGHHFELPQQFSLCAYSSNHVTVNTTSPCHIGQQHLEFQRFGVSNNKTCNPPHPRIKGLLTPLKCA
jgi:hypothetical protein